MPAPDVTEATLVFPHQLFADHPACAPGRGIILIEEHLFFRQYAFHKQKLAFHRASMKAWAEARSQMGYPVRYVENGEAQADVRKLIAQCASVGMDHLHIADTADDWLQRRIMRTAARCKVRLTWYTSPMFLQSEAEIRQALEDKKTYYHADFYIRQRKRLGLLLDPKGKPVGGRWSYDAENRFRWPGDRQPPAVQPAPLTPHQEEAVRYVNTHFPDNPGAVTGPIRYPVTREAALAWLDSFLHSRLHDFGPYEDAIVARASLLYHSLLSPLLNGGLLTPEEVIRATRVHASQSDIPLPSLEGFLRQIIGWREFVRGVYVVAGRRQRTTNAWGFHRRIPASFYTGHTGIPPVDITIRKILDTGYCHHIERLMVLGNFMLLCEFDPEDVYRWFMELFIDAYDWVMVPNVYGMSQFADGGLMTTKPYISGSTYLRKMSDYPAGDWQAVWDGLFWRFLHVHRDFFTSNPRLGMLIGTWDKMSPAKRNAHLAAADQFLQDL